jgi:integrase
MLQTTRRISEQIIADLPYPVTGNRLHYFSGASLQGKKAPAGFAVRVTASGRKTFVRFYRVGGKPFLATLGHWTGNAKGGDLTVLRAIIAATEHAKSIRDGEDPRPERTRRSEDGNKPEGETIADLLDEFVERYVEREAALRSCRNVRRTLERLVKPAIGNVGIYELRRSQVVRMLDTIADENGPVMADRALALTRKAFNWRAARDDDFQPPIVRGMAKTKPHERARTRILDDHEIRDLWAALDTMDGRYPAFVRAVFLTATRRDEAARMCWDEIDGDVWTIPGSRYKTKVDHEIPLTAAVRDQIGERPKDFARRPFVFSPINGETPFGDYSRAKKTIDTKIAEFRAKDGREPMPPWTLHDLRRTARSLMSRAGIPSDHAERALGHVIAGVRSVYDRHKFLEEKKRAFEALASLVEQILDPAPNVTQISRARG